MVHNGIEIGPGTKLPLPVGNGGKGGNNEEWSFDAHAINFFKECDGLDGLSQAHLVCQDAVSSRVRPQNNVKKK